MAKYAAIVAIRKHRDKTFGVFEPEGAQPRWYGNFYSTWIAEERRCAIGGITVPFRTAADIDRSFTECGEHWEVLK